MLIKGRGLIWYNSERKFYNAYKTTNRLEQQEIIDKETVPNKENYID